MAEEVISKHNNDRISYAFIIFNTEAVGYMNSIADMFVFIQGFLMTFSGKNYSHFELLQYNLFALN